MSAAIETHRLSKRFGSTEAVRDLTFMVPEGSIFALLGPNGSGKTTTIKTLMNILEPSAGQARVLGTDSRRLGPREFARIGYISENQELPEWMTVRELVAYCRPMYPGWDDAFASQLQRQFDLPPDRALKRLSRGMKLKAALLSSLAYRPRLLVLDEPFSGLDAVVREEFVRGILEMSERQGWTLFVSSHDIDEVERLADHVGVVSEGRLQMVQPLAALQARVRRIEATVDPGFGRPASLPASWMGFEVAGARARFVETDYRTETSEALARQVLGVSGVVSVEPLSLREIFLALAPTYRLPT